MGAKKSMRDQLVDAAKSNPKWSEWLRQFDDHGLKAADGAEVSDSAASELLAPTDGQSVDANAGVAPEQKTPELGILDYIAPAGEGKAPVGPIAPKIAQAAKAIADVIAPAATVPLDQPIPPSGAVAQNASGQYVDATGHPVGQPQEQMYSPGPTASGQPAQADAARLAAAAADEANAARTQARPRVVTSGGAPASMAIPDWAAQATMAAMSEVEVAKAKASALTRANESYLADLQEIRAQRAEYLRNAQARADEYERQIMTQEIDPNHYWGSLSTGQQIMSSIGIMLGAYGSGLGGGPNLALEQLNRNIDRDIEAQKANLGKKQTLYSMHLARTRDAEQAFAQTQADLLAMAKGHIQLVSDQFGGADAAARAQATVAAINKQLVDMNEKMANDRADRALKYAEIKKTNFEMALAGMKAQNQLAANPLAVRVPVSKRLSDGSTETGYVVKRAADEHAAAKVRDIQSASEKFLSDLDRYTELAERNPRGGNPKSEDVDEARRLQTMLIYGLSNAQGQGIVKEGEMDLYKRMIPDITEVRVWSPEYAKRLKGLRSIMVKNAAGAVSPYLAVE